MLAVSQEGINGINWFMVCRYKFGKAKSYFNNYWVFMDKNGPGLLLGHFFNWDSVHARLNSMELQEKEAQKD